jgi:Zn-dependent membrane protease YugP
VVGEIDYCLLFVVSFSVVAVVLVAAHEVGHSFDQFHQFSF